MANQEDQRARAEVRPVKERVEDELLAEPGVTGVDIGAKVTNGKTTGRVAIVVYVKKKKPKSALTPPSRSPPRSTASPRTWSRRRSSSRRRSVAARRSCGAAQVDATAYTTLQGGISMGPCRSVFSVTADVPAAGNYIFVGTLGAIVKDRTSGAMMAFTNFHVACVDSAGRSATR